MTSRFYFLFSTFLLILLSTFYFLFPIPASAARLFFDAPNRNLGSGERLSITLMLDSEEQSLNAVEGRVRFPDELVVLERIISGGSIISMWATLPALSADGVSFAGIIPGGFAGLLTPGGPSGQPGKIFRLEFRTQKTGNGIIRLEGGRALLNDGRGSEAELRTEEWPFTVNREGEAALTSPEVAVEDDTVPPEPFEPLLGRSPHLFDNQWFISFVVQDKQSGIARFEVQENRKQKIENRRWKIAESPYMLRDQGLRSFIYVKAIDQNSNERVAVLLPRYLRAWYEQPGLWSIIIILGALGAFWFFRRRSEKDKAQNAKNATQN